MKNSRQRKVVCIERSAASSVHEFFRIYNTKIVKFAFYFNLYTLSEEEKSKLTGLPASLDEAIAELEADHDYLTAGGVFPERLLNQLIKRNKAAASKVSRQPHPMEFALYYDL